MFNVGPFSVHFRAIFGSISDWQNKKLRLPHLVLFISQELAQRQASRSQSCLSWQSRIRDIVCRMTHGVSNCNRYVYQSAGPTQQFFKSHHPQAEKKYSITARRRRRKKLVPRLKYLRGPSREVSPICFRSVLGRASGHFHASLNPQAQKKH